MSEQETDKTWQKIIKILKKHRQNNPFDSILLTLNIHTLIQQSAEKLTQSIAELHQSLAYIGKQLHYKIPVYIVFTHADLIAGFSEYFNHLSAADREQVFGLTLPETKSATDMLQQFQMEYEALLKRLHAQLPQLLHHTRKLEQRQLLHAFPLQIESINSICYHLIEQLFVPKGMAKKWIARGVFFVSSQQQGIPIDRLANAIEHNYQVNSPAQQPLYGQQKSYFIKELLQNIIPNDAEISSYHMTLKRKKRWYYAFSYPIITAATVVCIFTLAVLFNHDINLLNDAETSLQIYQAMTHTKSATNEHINQLTSALGALQNANQQVSKLSTHIFANIAFKNIISIKKNVNKTYNDSLSQQFLPLVFQLVEQELLKTKTQDPGKLYSDLTVYLMLGEPKHLNKAYISHWFSHYWSHANLSEKEINTRLTLINDALAENNSHSLLQPGVIATARNYLNSLPTSYLAYLNLKFYSNNKSQLKINYLANVFFYSGRTTTIPYIYTKEGFATAYTQLIPQISKELTHGSWILGERNSNDKQTAAELEQQVKMFYYADYVNWWNFYIYNTHPAAFRNVQQAAQTFSALSDIKSPMITIYNTVAENTAPITAPNKEAHAFNKNIAYHFRDLQQTSEASLQKLQPLFQQLHNYFQALALASNTDSQAFLFTKQRFLDISTNKDDPLNNLFTATKQYPQPIKGWLDALAINSWYLLLHHSQLYINTAWQQQVMAEYRENILQRFPLAADAQKEIPLNAFQHFFAPKGTLDNFVRENLQPFIDSSGSTWTLKQINNMSITIDHQTMDDLLRATIIRAMFFENNSNQMNVSFNLKPLTFEPIVRNLILNINGQKVFDYQGSDKISRFFWPGQTGQSAANLQITNINNEHYSISENGDWAWFRLLSKANLQQLNDTQHYSLIFDLNGSAAKYQLTAQNPINPFIPGVLSSFNLPDKIVS